MNIYQQQFLDMIEAQAKEIKIQPDGSIQMWLDYALFPTFIRSIGSGFFLKSNLHVEAAEHFVKIKLNAVLAHLGIPESVMKDVSND